MASRRVGRRVVKALPPSRRRGAALSLLLALVQVAIFAALNCSCNGAFFAKHAPPPAGMAAMLEADTPLIDAVRNGRDGVVAAMLADGAYSVNMPMKDGHGCNHSVCPEKGHLSIVTKLLDANADANQPGFNGGTPLLPRLPPEPLRDRHQAARGERQRGYASMGAAADIACQMGHAAVLRRCWPRKRQRGRATTRPNHAAVHRLRGGPRRGRHKAARCERQRESGSQRWQHATVHRLLDGPPRGRRDAARRKRRREPGHAAMGRLLRRSPQLRPASPTAPAAPGP